MGRKLNIVLGAIIGLALIVSAAWYASSLFDDDPETKAFAVVHDGEGELHWLDLSLDQEQSITTELGTNLIVVEDGTVYVRDADCGNLDCVHQGKISAPGRQIICLPHKLWIEVVEDGAQSGEMNVETVAGDEQGESAEAADAGAQPYDAVAR